MAPRVMVPSSLARKSSMVGHGVEGAAFGVDARRCGVTVRAFGRVRFRRAIFFFGDRLAQAFKRE